MKLKNFIILYLLLLFNSFENVTAQKQLTNREVYNFEVGDVIHTSFTHL